jgi:hypothetical protein
VSLVRGVALSRQLWPFAFLTRAAAHASVANAAWTALAWDTVAEGDAPIGQSHWASGTPTRLIVRVAGTYSFLGQIGWPTGGGSRFANITLNGGAAVAYDTRPATASPDMTIHTVETGPMRLAAGDYVELLGYQSSGGGLVPNSTYTHLRATLLGPPGYSHVVLPPPLVVALPSNPYDGQEVHYLADAANAIVWHLRYRGASPGAQKWEFVGGTPLMSLVAALETTASGAYVDLTTVGPSVTVPLAGTYDVEHGVVLSHNTVGAFLAQSFSVGATAASDTDWCVMHEPVANLVQTQMTVRRKTGVTTGAAITAKYRTSGATASYQSRWLRARPVVVG